MHMRKLTNDRERTTQNITVAKPPRIGTVPAPIRTLFFLFSVLLMNWHLGFPWLRGDYYPYQNWLTPRDKVNDSPASIPFICKQSNPKQTPNYLLCWTLTLQEAIFFVLITPGSSTRLENACSPEPTIIIQS